MDQKDNYLSKVAKSKLNRVMAVICLIIIAVLIIATIVTGITGSKYFFGCLALTIIVPILFYVILWTGRVLYNLNKDDIEK